MLCYAMLCYSILFYPILSIYTCGSVSALVVSRSALPMARTSFLVFVLSDLKMAWVPNVQLHRATSRQIKQQASSLSLLFCHVSTWPLHLPWGLLKKLKMPTRVVKLASGQISNGFRWFDTSDDLVHLLPVRLRWIDTELYLPAGSLSSIVDVCGTIP